MKLEWFDPEKFPAGTIVGAYDRSDWPITDPPVLMPEGPPPGEPVEVVEVPENREFTFENLQWEYRYWLGAEVEGEWRYATAVSGSFNYWLAHELYDLIVALEARVKALEGP